MVKITNEPIKGDSEEIVVSLQHNDCSFDLTCEIEAPCSLLFEKIEV